jgi:hypothetical protein
VRRGADPLVRGRRPRGLCVLTGDISDRRKKPPGGRWQTKAEALRQAVLPTSFTGVASGPWATYARKSSTRPFLNTAAFERSRRAADACA